MKTTILERIYRRLLAEGGAPDVSKYGAVVGEDSDLKTATIYDVAAAGAILSQKDKIVEDDIDELQAEVAGTIVSYVEISEPKDPCWDAYKISAIIGPGKISYGVAYALSPSGLIIPDRHSMTPQAVSAWKGMSGKIKGGDSKRKMLPCDDVGLREDEDVLNYAYGGEGWEVSALAAMERQHWALCKKIGKKGTAVLNDAMTSAGAKKFTDYITAKG